MNLEILYKLTYIFALDFCFYWPEDITLYENFVAVKNFVA